MTIDVFRGITIAVMIFVNTVYELDNTPVWSKHAPYIGLTYVDLVAPAFLFMVGLTYWHSYRRSIQRVGLFSTGLKFLRRYCALIGMGMLGVAFFSSRGIIFSWGALQTICLSGLLLFPFMSLPKLPRLLIAGVMLLVYQFMLGFSIMVEGTVT
ncbi:MAG: heparan-alpha-glucosaminide N-acetyltransferase domain-containing protein [Promethearchaeota archaeon]